MPAGDYCILIGSLHEFTPSEGGGLGYVNGQYFSLGLERATFEKTSGAAICGAIVEDRDTVLVVQAAEGLLPPIAQMKTRFALDQRTRNFALYLGDTQVGAIHTATTRT